jgi:hypothetical protein
MNKKNTPIETKRFGTAAMVFCLSLLLLPMAKAGMVQAPDGFDDLLLYMQNGVFDPTEPHPVIPNCAGGFCFSDYFQTAIQQRDSAEIGVLVEQAKSFFNARFGIDLDDPANQGRVQLLDFTLDPRGDYRAYVISDTYVPPSGFFVNDGGWILMVVDPDGYELGGEFTGQTVPAGAMVLFGEYQIEVQRGNRIVRTIDLSYRSGSFVLFDANGIAHFGCELKRGRLDENNFYDLSVERDGLAQGYAGALEPVGNGLFKANVRNTLTFNDDLGGI